MKQLYIEWLGKYKNEKTGEVLEKKIWLPWGVGEWYYVNYRMRLEFQADNVSLVGYEFVSVERTGKSEWSK